MEQSQPYLTQKEETVVCDHLIEAAKAGYSKTRTQVKLIVESVVKEKGILRSSRISDGWWRRFLERQWTLSLQRGDPTAHIRMNSVNKAAIDSYYNLLEDILTEHKLFDCPAQIYNMDESAWCTS